ncbi:MAG: ankyrin repeat domain-containing protein [Ekhidna sp.]
MNNDHSKDAWIRSGDFKGFIHSVMKEDMDGVAYYISIGMDVNFLHPEIMTNPLIEATKMGNLEIAKLLLENGADPEIVSQIGESAIKIAKESQNKEVITLLMSKKKPPLMKRLITNLFQKSAK